MKKPYILILLLFSLVVCVCFYTATANRMVISINMFKIIEIKSEPNEYTVSKNQQ